MKRIFTILTLFAAFICAVACSSTGSTPTSVVEQYAEYIKAGKYESIADLFYYDSSDPEAAAENKTMMKNLFTEKVKPEIEKHGGLKSYTIEQETISEDGKSAVVDLTFHFGNGDDEAQKSNLNMVDGKWYLSVGK